ncbi:MAG: PAS domain-containing hybrid sensor histidine kinase/response regulator, partial [Isosphaeraceae bacterium]
LRQREAQYRAVIETCTDGFWMADLEGRILEVNDAIARRSGYSRAELLGMHIRDLEAWETPEETLNHIRAIRTHGADLFESMLRTKDGSTWPIEANVAYWPGSGGRILAFQRDITERKQAERELRHRLDLQDQLAKIAEAVPGAMYTFHMRPDGSSFMTYASLSFDEITGLDGSAIAEDLSPCFARFHPEDRPSVMKSIAMAVSTQSAWHAEFRYLHPTRGEIWMEGWSAPRVEPDGRLLFHGYLTDVTQRKHIEEALRDSEAKLQAVVNTAVDAIIMIEARGTVLSFNPSAERIFGFAADEVLGHDVSMLMPEPYSREHGEYLARYLRTGEARVVGRRKEIPAQRKDGSVFPMEIGLSKIQVGDKVIFVGILHDITGRKAAEDEIRQLNTSLELMVERRTAELESMLANAPIGLAFYDRECRFLRINRCLAAINGLPIEAHLGQTIGQVLPALGQIIEPIIVKVFETGRPHTNLELEGETHAQPGKPRYWLASYYPVTRADGTIISVGATVTEITDQRCRERELDELNRALKEEIAERERLERQARLLAAVLETAPDFVGIADPSGRVIYLNRAFKEALHRSPESEPLMIKDCHPPHVVRLLETEALPTAARLGVWKGDTEFVRWDGQVIPTSKLIISHTDTAGRVQYYSTIMRDISKRKELEDALRRHGQELAIANAELARASRLKDEFLASMSHELRTPLNGILNISQGLAEEVYGTMTPRQQEVLHDVEECGQHLLSLINDILDVAKIEAGKLDIEPGPITVGSFCQATLRLVKETAQKKKLRLALNLDESVDVLSSDERRLKQILVNLLSNAVKFTPEGGSVTLEVAGDRLSEQVRFNVRDTGIGISPDDLGRLFQPFVQLDSRLSRNYSGTGLGLALVKRLATLLGGQTLVQSQPGSGSCFTIVLPWNQEPEATVQEEVPAENQGESPDTPPAEQALVVLVEDNALTARVLRDYLCFKGFQVECASNAIHGLALIERLRPGLVIMDIQMPGIDGFRAIERIRRLPEVANVPIIALTALAMPGDRERCLQAGATAYAPKPVALDELLHLASRLAHARSCYLSNI